MEEIKIFNTLTRKVEPVVTMEKGKLGLYTCGPTVYGDPHIGNLRTYIFEDLLRKTFEYFGYRVNHVMNITDVGHLTSDADTGDDKMQLGAKREGMNSWQLAEKYTAVFLRDIAGLNIKEAGILCKATDYIREQIDLILKLKENGLTYVTSDGVYYDTSRFPDYPNLARLDVEGLRGGARIALSQEKKNKTDFALWKFSKPGEKRDMEWDSPFGKGFPGWAIECSAMSIKHLGEQFDMHTGGVDHIPIHHTNEIAQSEGATGKKPWVNYWIHGEFLVFNKEKMSKSKGGTITLSTLKEKGYEPLAYRYFCLGTSYRKQLSFFWEALDGARNTYDSLREHILALDAVEDPARVSSGYLGEFEAAMKDDLNAPVALSALWRLLKDQGVTPQEKYNTAIKMDSILGLGIKDMRAGEDDIPAEIMAIARERENFRKIKDWKKSDELRNAALSKGYEILDMPEGSKLKKRK